MEPDKGVMTAEGSVPFMASSEQDIFLKTLAQCGNAAEAARFAGISKSRLYRMRSTDRDFAEAWAIALEEATDRLTNEAIRRAVRGVEEVKYFKGEPVGTVRKYSDQLLMFLLRAHKPEIYGKQAVNETNTEVETQDHARSSLLKKMETLVQEEDDRTTPTPD